MRASHVLRAVAALTAAALFRVVRQQPAPGQTLGQGTRVGGGSRLTPLVLTARAAGG